MTEKIKEQILAVRATGRTNMFDTNMVHLWFLLRNTREIMQNLY